MREGEFNLGKKTEDTEETKFFKSEIEKVMERHRIEKPPHILVKKDVFESYLAKKTITDHVNEAYEIAKSKGWHDENHAASTLLALIHSEVSEALEADRVNDDVGFAEELADVCIRVFDLCGLYGIDLEKTIIAKMEFNKTRDYKHGGKSY